MLSLTKIILSISILLCVNFTIAQDFKSGDLEKKALKYFCENISEIKQTLTKNQIRFKGATIGKYSNVYDIADCKKDISLITDSIPDKLYLDSLNNFYKSKVVGPLTMNYECTFLKKKIFAPFNKYIYTLHLFHAINYKDFYFVEIYLVNKNKETWIVGIKFDKKSLKPVSHCTSYLIY